MRKNSSLFKILLILLVVFGVLYISRNAEESISNAITILTAIFGFLAIIYQLNMDHSIKRAEFIYSLNDSFNQDELIALSYKKLKDARGKDTVFSKEEVSDMGSYIMFFIIMDYLVSKGHVKIKMIDKAFANKFFLLCHNLHVQKYQLSANELEINYPIMELYVEWYNYRVINGLPVLYPKYNYSNNDKIFVKKNDLIKMKKSNKKSLKFHINRILNKSNM